VLILPRINNLADDDMLKDGRLTSTAVT